MRPGEAPQNLSEDTLLAQAISDTSLAWKQWGSTRIEPIEDET